MREWFRKIRKRFYDYRPLVKVEIKQENLLNNFFVVANRVKDWQVWPVLKSNAYGHGLVEVANVFKDKVDFLIVDSYYEAMILCSQGIKTKILVIGFTHLENILNNKLKNVSFVIADLAWLKELAGSLSQEVCFHLKIDTGMNRQGVEINELEQTLETINKNRNFLLEGVCSHLADAESNDEGFTLKQIASWNKIVRKMKKANKLVKYFHLSATEGIKYYQKIDANAMRLGLGLYGFSTNRELAKDLRSVLSLKSMISSMRTILPGEKVGYGLVYAAKHKRKIATIPLGYFEGIDRRLSDKGRVRVMGKECPIVGRVSMNITSIDVSDVDVKIGDEVEIIGLDKTKNNTVDKIAKECGTIPYEVLVHIPSMLRREVV